MPEHRDRRRPVAPLPHQPPQALPLRAQHQRRRQRQVEVGIRLGRVARQPDRPDVGRLQRPRWPARCSRRSAILTCAIAPADAFAADAVDRRGAPRLPNHAVDARRVGDAQDRAEVVRVLDAVEHDDERRAVRRPHQIGDVVVGACPRCRPPRPGAARRATARSSSAASTVLARGRARAAASRSSSCTRLSARADDPQHSARAARASASSDGVDAVDESLRRAPASRLYARRCSIGCTGPPVTLPYCLSCLRAYQPPATHRSASANAAARSRQPRIGARPADAGSSAPRSIAGTARSSSGPPAAPVSATRIGWNSPFAFWPVCCFTAPHDGPEPVAIDQARSARQLAREALDHLARARRARAPRRRPAPSPPAPGSNAKRNASRDGISSSRSTDAVAIGQHRREVRRAPPGPASPARPSRRKYGERQRCDPHGVGRPQVVTIHPGELLLVEHAGAVADVARSRSDARARRPAAVRRRRPATSR